MAGVEGTAFAGEVRIGIGFDDVLDQTDTQAAAIVFELHGDRVAGTGALGLHFAGALQADADGDIWAGAGIAATFDLSPQWFAEASFMPGLYSAGSGGTPLNGDIQFRSLIGVGYRISEVWSVGITIDHKSNANLSSPNPGSETLALRFGRSF